MKVSTIFKQILREQAELKELFGVSFEARIWNSIIRSQLRLGNTYIKNNKPLPDLTIHGKDYPKQYQVFPIDILHIYINPKYVNGAAYDENKSGYDENKQYHVYLHFGPSANESAINHELRHSYEDFMRMSQGGTPMKNTKEGMLIFGGDFEKFYMQGRGKEPFHSLLMGLYLTSKIERSGYSETVYDNDAPAIEMIKSSIKNADYASHWTYPEILKSRWDEIKKEYRVPIFDKFNDYESFIKWAVDEIQYKGEKSLKKLQKVKFHREQNKKEGDK